jgi:hypothetical protein
VQGGLQHIKTLDGYVHPIDIISSLLYVHMHPYTNDEWDTLPYVEWTSDDMDWDPGVLEHTFDDDEPWYHAIKDLETKPYYTTLFNEYRDYCGCVVIQDALLTPASVDDSVLFYDALDQVVSDDLGDVIADCCV